MWILWCFFYVDFMLILCGLHGDFTVVLWWFYMDFKVILWWFMLISWWLSVDYVDLMGFGDMLVMKHGMVNLGMEVS